MFLLVAVDLVGERVEETIACRVDSCVSFPPVQEAMKSVCIAPNTCIIDQGKEQQLTIAPSLTGVESEGIQQWELLGVLSHRSANERVF